MRPMLLLMLLSATMFVTGCAMERSSSIPCPRVTEFPAELQRRAAEELENAPAAREMFQGMAPDREYNRSLCP